MKLRSNLAILESHNAVPLTKTAAIGARDGLSSLEIAQARQRGRAFAERSRRVSYEEAMNALTHKLFAKEISHAEFKKKERRLKDRFGR